ncbi:MAG: hypothetical protein K6G26_08705 [Lachnospiraceae bacterium]|nr:hypothetical protein [Lachnospiraceae bacterium]
MFEFIKNFYNMFPDNKDLFCKPEEYRIEKLKELFGDKVNKIIDFYSKYEPDEIPLLESYVNLLGIDWIIMENTELSPGAFLSKHGFYVFATTVGGNALCINTNEANDGDASVYIADHSRFYYNDETDQAKIMGEEAWIYHELNYDSIVKFSPKIESSFFTFMEKVSRNEYADVEDYLM